MEGTYVFLLFSSMTPDQLDFLAILLSDGPRPSNILEDGVADSLRLPGYIATIVIRDAQYYAATILGRTQFCKHHHTTGLKTALQAYKKSKLPLVRTKTPVPA